MVAFAFGSHVHPEHAFVFLSRRRKAVGETLLCFVSFEEPFQKGGGFFYTPFVFFLCTAFISDGKAFVGAVFGQLFLFSGVALRIFCRGLDGRKSIAFVASIDFQAVFVAFFSFLSFCRTDIDAFRSVAKVFPERF